MPFDDIEHWVAMKQLSACIPGSNLIWLGGNEKMKSHTNTWIWWTEWIYGSRGACFSCIGSGTFFLINAM